MRKLLLIAATTAAISGTSAFAAPNAENMFYLKAGAGADWMQNVKLQYRNSKAKSKVAPIFLLAAGYYFLDNVRGDLELDIVSNPKFKASANKNTVFPGAKLKGRVGALLANVYFDMFDVSIAGIFAGGGVGVSKVKVKGNAVGSDTVAINNSTKNKYDLAWQATIGGAAELGEGVQGELAYSWRDYGKTGKWKNINQVFNEKKIHLRGHNVTASVVFGL